MKKIFLSVVIPAYNEKNNLEKGVLLDVFNYLKKQVYTWEVIIVDDGSEDETTKLVSSFLKDHHGFFLLPRPHRGKGGAICVGIKQAEGEIVLFCDLDQSTPISEIEKLLPKFREGFDLVIGQRLERKNSPLIRKIISRGFIFLRKFILGLSYQDTQCGFKTGKREALLKIIGKTEIVRRKEAVIGSDPTVGFDLELLYLAQKLRYKIAEVRVEWRHQENKSFSALKHSWLGFKYLLRVGWKARTGKYKLDCYE